MGIASGTIAGKAHGMNDARKTVEVAPPEDIEDLIGNILAIAGTVRKLPAERILAERMGVKRHQLRRGLQYLRESGQLEAARPRKRSVNQQASLSDLVSNTNPIEVVELRMMIEPPLARLAALRATPNQISNLQKAAIAISNGDPNAPSEIDLHRMIASASGNTLADEFYGMLRKIEADARLNAQFKHERSRQDFAEHKAIIDAIAARDGEGAEKAMRSHLESVRGLASNGIA